MKRARPSRVDLPASGRARWQSAGGHAQPLVQLTTCTAWTTASRRIRRCGSCRMPQRRTASGCCRRCCGRRSGARPRIGGGDSAAAGAVDAGAATRFRRRHSRRFRCRARCPSCSIRRRAGRVLRISHSPPASRHRQARRRRRAERERATRCADQSANRLLYATPTLTDTVHISGTPRVTLRVASSAPAANLSVWLVMLPYDSARAGSASHPGLDRRAGGRTSRITNLSRRAGTTTRSCPASRSTPGKFYDLTFDLEPDDEFVPPGKRLAVMIMSSDREFTLWPQAGHAADGRSRAFVVHDSDRGRTESAGGCGDEVARRVHRALPFGVVDHGGRFAPIEHQVVERMDRTLVALVT